MSSRGRKRRFVETDHTLHRGAPITAIVNGVWMHTQIVQTNRDMICVAWATPDQVWWHHRDGEGTTWIRGHANKRELAALAVAYALADSAT